MPSAPAARCRDVPAAALIDAKRAVHSGVTETSDLQAELGAIADLVAEILVTNASFLPDEIVAMADDALRAGLLPAEAEGDSEARQEPAEEPAEGEEGG